MYNIYSPWKYQDPELDIVHNILNNKIKINTECTFYMVILTIQSEIIIFHIQIVNEHLEQIRQVKTENY